MTVTGWPCGDGKVYPWAGKLSVVVVGVKLTEVQLFTRFAALTVPSPVARSYPRIRGPGWLWNCRWDKPGCRSRSSRLLLQLGERARHARHRVIALVARHRRCRKNCWPWEPYRARSAARATLRRQRVQDVIRIALAGRSSG